MLPVPVPGDVLMAGPPPKITSWRRFARVFFGRKVVLVSLIVLILLILMAIFAPLLAPYSPNNQDTGDRCFSRASRTGWGPTLSAATR